MSRHAPPRLPLGPLMRAAGATDFSDLAVKLDCNHRSVQRASSEGVSFWQGDQWAIKLGLHPAVVWCERWREANHELDRRTA